MTTTTILHIVLFRFRTGVDWSDPRSMAAEQTTEQHPLHVPEILTWTCGRNITRRDVAYDFAVLGTFADQAAVERYLVHPHHQQGVEHWRELADWVVTDLEVQYTAHVGGEQ